MDRFLLNIQEIWVPCQSRHSYWEEMNFPFEEAAKEGLSRLCNFNESSPIYQGEDWFNQDFGKDILHAVGKMIVDMIFEEEPWWGQDYVKVPVYNEEWDYTYYDYQYTFGYGYTAEMFYQLAADQYLALVKINDDTCMKEVHEVRDKIDKHQI